jgi:rRNA maturation protein Nop10
MVKVCEKHDMEYTLRSSRWRCGECLKEQCRRYNAKHSEQQKLWHKSPDGKRARVKYDKSHKGKETHKRERKKILARKAITRAVKKGILTPSEVCPKCKKQIKTEAHHHNGYDKSCQLDVVWLCRSCHVSVHRLQKADW